MAEPFDTFYYYTDAFGLQGIPDPPSWPLGPVQKPKDAPPAITDIQYTYGGAALFKASDVRYMNDTTELLFGARILKEHLLETLDVIHEGSPLWHAFRQAADYLLVEDRVHEWPWRLFAACFCEGKGDLLSQWRGYGGGTGGFAIGFSRASLEHTFSVQLASNGMVADLPLHAASSRSSMAKTTRAPEPSSCSTI